MVIKLLQNCWFSRVFSEENLEGCIRLTYTRELKCHGFVVPDGYLRKRKGQANLKRFLFANWDLLILRVLQSRLPLWIKDIAWLVSLPVDWDEENLIT